ncbi:MAG: glycosyltransferase, partial [Leeuwenhoekiella sp.]
MQTVIVIIYTIALALIFIYSLAQLSLLLNYFKSKRQADFSEKFDFDDNDQIPLVTVQLPLYNEMYVAQRLIDNIALLDYPKDKLEIQVLDDSTDESINATAKKIAQLQEQGLNIKHIIRIDRTGFKAGALKEGLLQASG